MSLMKLLSVSRSFVSGKNPSGRYRMAEQGLLPKFAPVERPDSAALNKNREAASTQKDGETARSTRRTSQIDGGVPKPALKLRPARPSPFTGAAIDLAAAPEPKTATVRRNAVSASTNGFPWRKSWFTAEPAETIRPRPPAQTDLSLDAVKPVRNDLSDADLEVVRAKRETSQPGASPPSGRRTFKAELTGLAWSRLTARLFDSERARV